ncbi:MAG: response regulator transcription factor [Dehalococcoidia bacterium]
MDKLRVFVADEHPIVRYGLQDLLEADPSIAVVGGTGLVSEALLLLQTLRADVTLVDPSLGCGKGIELIRRIYRLPNPPASLAVSDCGTAELIEKTFQAGARGFLIKTVPGHELVQAVWRVFRGDGVLSECLITPVVTTLARLAQEHSIHECGFSDTELKILRQLASGATNREIARHEFMSEPTVKRKTHAIYRKLGASDRAGAVSAALRLGLI